MCINTDGKILFNGIKISMSSLRFGLFQEWRTRLDSKTSDFEHALSTGRFYLEREGADRRLSSASCDSRIMDGK